MFLESPEAGSEVLTAVLMENSNLSDTTPLWLLSTGYTALYLRRQKSPHMP
jgi:hypothetical protein